MASAPNQLCKALADATRRAIFERPSRDGEQTVQALTDGSGVSQPAISKHLAVLKLAALVVIGAKDARPTTAPGRKLWPP